ncbi:MAG: response regulator [Chloroflexaceae bacterium]|nr:response regulator [Chloroflexaceae bacterium]NJO07771.1 response regulator [Chloroflexaceae bacterium]
MAATILVVDDENVIRQLISYQLQGAGYQVCTAGNGREALLQVEQAQPDLVVLDVMMPDMLGWEVCQHIRSISTTPIIMLTSRGTDGDIESGLKAGADAYLTKPYTAQQLLDEVAVILQGTAAATVARGSLVPSSNPARFLITRMRAKYPYPLQYSDYHDIGRRLEEARRRNGWTLYDAERETQVRWDFIQAMERGHYLSIPFLQRQEILLGYSRRLGIDLHTFTLPPDLMPPPPPRPFPFRTLMLMVMLTAVGGLVWWQFDQIFFLVRLLLDSIPPVTL